MKTNAKSITVTVTYTVEVTPEQIVAIRGWQPELASDEQAAEAEAAAQVAERLVKPVYTIK